jgi:hypothetical protein
VKDSSHGTHQPGLRRAGEGEPTEDEFKALVARVAALEAAAPAPAAGSRKYWIRWFQGVDASAGDASPGSVADVPPGTWNIVNVLRFRISDGLAGLQNPAPEDATFPTGIDSFIHPIVSDHGGALTFVGGNDYSLYYFLVLLESSDP